MEKQELFGGCRVVYPESYNFYEGYRLEMDDRNIYVKLYKKVFLQDEFVAKVKTNYHINTIFRCQMDNRIFYKEGDKFITPEELIKKVIRLTRRSITQLDIDENVINVYNNQIAVNC